MPLGRCFIFDMNKLATSFNCARIFHAKQRNSAWVYTLRCVRNSLKSLNYTWPEKRICLYLCIFLHVQMCATMCSVGETHETLTLVETETHLPSWYPLPQARDKKRRWYTVPCSSVPIGPDCWTERFGGTEFRLKWKHTKGFKTQQHSPATGGGRSGRRKGRVCSGIQRRATDPMWCCRDNTA